MTIDSVAARQKKLYWCFLPNAKSANIDPKRQKHKKKKSKKRKKKLIDLIYEVAAICKTSMVTLEMGKRFPTMKA